MDRFSFATFLFFVACATTFAQIDNSDTLIARIVTARQFKGDSVANEAKHILILRPNGHFRRPELDIVRRNKCPKHPFFLPLCEY